MGAACMIGLGLALARARQAGARRHRRRRAPDEHRRARHHRSDRIRPTSRSYASTTATTARPAGRRATPVSASIWKRSRSAAASNTRAPWPRQPTLRAAHACFERPTAQRLCAFAYGRRNHPSSNAISMPPSAAIASATASFQAGRERAEPTRQHASNALIVISLAQALFAPRSVAIVGQSDDPGKAAGRPLKFLRADGLRRPRLSDQSRRETVLGERAWPSLSALPEAPGARLYRHADRCRHRSGRGMRQARGEGGDRARRRLRRGRRGGSGARGAAARDLRPHRHPHRRTVEPRRRRPAHAERCSPPMPRSTSASLPLGRIFVASH